ncbi:MAG: hypothetical protein ACJ79R_21945 [Anaeromyxobacteraceae bacterium]
MKRILHLVPALALLLGACVDNRSSVQILSRAAPSDPASCKFAAGGESQMGPGTLDVGFAADPRALRYSLAVYVNNNLVDPQESSPESVTSSKAWTAVAAKVRLNPKEYVDQFGASPPLLAISDENVLPLDGNTIPVGGNDVELVDAVSRSLGTKIAAALGPDATASVILGITLQGRTADGARVDTGEWYFPIDVCSGCLAAPACAPPAVAVPGSCFNVGQDSAGTCQ